MFEILRLSNKSIIFMGFTDFLKAGLSAEKTGIVTDDNTAAALGSGSLAVYGTPGMAALMEAAALSAVSLFLPRGWSTVGTELNIKHVSATPLGMKVYAKAELTAIDGRALEFKLEAFDEAGKIGEGVHRRFIIEEEKFLAKTRSKK